MAELKIMFPFIIDHEGGKNAHTNDPLDSGGETRCGVTRKTFGQIVEDSDDRFAAMVGGDDDWQLVIQYFANMVCFSQINSQRIANDLLDWVWGSGKHNPEYDVQQLINSCFDEHISVDGNLGPLTIAAINRDDEQSLYDHINDRREKYIADIVAANPSQQHWIHGWENRIHDLETFNSSL